MSLQPIAGRSCPLHYRYGPASLASAPEQPADTLYVIGGLYGNLHALRAIETMAAGEPGPVTLCFNGDFNWFNIDADGFFAVNQFVSEHDAIQGNVEAELVGPDADAGCGCAYPESVDEGVVVRSNAIHARLKTTARQFTDVLEWLAALPMVRRYRVGNRLVGIVHGDAESLAGWRFDIQALDSPSNRSWIESVFDVSNVDVFASTHTCLPVLRQFGYGSKRKLVINNGAAGMPNFSGRCTGLITRISVESAPLESLYGTRIGSVYVDALEVPYDQHAWVKSFLSNWPADSPAYDSYFQRIRIGPSHAVEQAFRVDSL